MAVYPGSARERAMKAHALGNPAKAAGFPLSHSSGDGDPTPPTGPIACS